MQQLFGIMIVFGSVFGGYAMMGGKFHAIWQPLELLVIAGAGFGAFIIGNPRLVTFVL